MIVVLMCVAWMTSCGAGTHIFPVDIEDDRREAAVDRGTVSLPAVTNDVLSLSSDDGCQKPVVPSGSYMSPSNAPSDGSFELVQNEGP